MTALEGTMTRPRRAKAAGFCAALLMVLTLGGCANLTPTQRRVGGGTLGGAAAGAAIGAIAGNAGMGAAIGAGAGLVGGILYDQHEKSKERAYREGVQAGRQQR